MHGFILTEVQQFVESIADKQTWYAILDRAGLPDADFHNFLEYPDEQVVAIVGAASEVTGLSPAEVLERYGVFLGKDLFQIYRPIIDPAWRTIEFLEGIEQTIHRVVRSRNRRARPPGLVCERTGPEEVTIVYTSPRRLCALARGLVLGVAEHYGEALEIAEDRCMHRGDAECRIRVRRLEAGTPPTVPAEEESR